MNLTAGLSLRPSLAWGTCGRQLGTVVGSSVGDKSRLHSLTGTDRPGHPGRKPNKEPPSGGNSGMVENGSGLSWTYYVNVSLSSLSYFHLVTKSERSRILWPVEQPASESGTPAWV